jgi:biopolymer transport protein TolR
VEVSNEKSSRRSGVSAEINVVPMADIMLVLLIIFMISTPLIQSGVAVNLAQAVHAEEAPEAEAEDATIVTITRNREVYVNRMLVAGDMVFEQISEAVAKAPDRPLFVRGDVATPYGKIVEIVDVARDAGVERIGLIVDRRREEGGLR